MAYKYKYGNFTYEFLTPSDINPIDSRPFSILVYKGDKMRRLFLKMSRVVMLPIKQHKDILGVDMKKTKFDLTKERKMNNFSYVIPSSQISKALRDDILNTFKKRYKSFIYKPMSKTAKANILKKLTKEQIETIKKRGERLLKSASKKKVIRKKVVAKKK